MTTRRLIPEFEPQSGVILTWPHATSDWRDHLASVEAVYLEIFRAISRYEPVLIICHDDQHVSHVTRLLAGTEPSATGIRLIVIPTDDTWIRDYGPLSVQIEQQVRLVNFMFNGWGNRHAFGLDDKASSALSTASVFRIPELLQQALVLEGGAIDTDGQGSLLATARCLMDRQRNPEPDQAVIEDKLNTVLGIERILWLEHGSVPGDDTNGHVDMLARFCSPNDIAYLQCTDPGDAHYNELAAMERQLQTFVARDGTPYRLHALPLPAPVYSDSGTRLPASYANFLIINHAVLLPVYNDPADEIAREVLTQCFPEREVLPVNCLPLLEQYGSLHCASMQLAEGILL